MMTYGGEGSKKPVALFSIAVMFIWGCIAINSASKLKPPTQQEKWFPAEHMFDGVIDTMTSGFSSATAANYVPLTLTWGISGIDRGKNKNGEQVRRETSSDAFC